MWSRVMRGMGSRMRAALKSSDPADLRQEISDVPCDVRGDLRMRGVEELTMRKSTSPAAHEKSEIAHHICENREDQTRSNAIPSRSTSAAATGLFASRWPPPTLFSASTCSRSRPPRTPSRSARAGAVAPGRRRSEARCVAVATVRRRTSAAASRRGRSSV